MTITISEAVLEKTDLLLNRYQMVDKKQPILLAFSGGKDSLLTSLVLTELGYNALAIHINMGFPNSKDHTKYILEMAKRFHIKIEVFNVTNSNMQSKLPKAIRDNICKRLEILFNQTQNIDDNYTPCTHCYNVKFLVLQYLANLYNVEHIALGHHGTDAIVSLLKSALMYIDRWDRKHETFSRSNFEQLIIELTKDHKNNEILPRIEELVKQDCASTDEPPVKINLMEAYGQQLKVIRPLFNVFEHDIRKIYANTSIKFRFDGCEHNVKLRLTPRELIHCKLFATEASLELMQYLHQIITYSLNQDGTMRFDARNNRSKLLGKQYKCSTLSNIKL